MHHYVTLILRGVPSELVFLTFFWMWSYLRRLRGNVLDELASLSYELFIAITLVIYIVPKSPFDQTPTAMSPSSSAKFPTPSTRSV